MTKQIDMVGKRFFSLNVILFKETLKTQRMWLCRCDCGNYITVKTADLNRGHVRSCGCEKIKKLRKLRFKHGLTNTRLFKIWHSMLGRCNPRGYKFKNYNVKGISVCDEWKNDFKTFHVWSLKNGYRENLTIDRINGDGNYEPSNCRWVSYLEQSRNKKETTMVEYQGKNYLFSELSKIINVNAATLRARYRLGAREDKLLSRTRLHCGELKCLK